MTYSFTLKQGAIYVFLAVLAVYVVIALFITTHGLRNCTQNCACPQDGDELPWSRLHQASVSSKPDHERSHTNNLAPAPYVGPQRTYQEWPSNVSFPCFEAEEDWKTIYRQKQPVTEGLLFAREKKTGSSTVAGIILRLAHRKGELINSSKGPCKMRIDHGSARRMLYGERDKTKSFLISLLRDPTKQAISAYFHFQVSEKKEDPIDAHFQRHFLDKLDHTDYYTKSLTTRDVNFTTDDPNVVVQEIIDSYDFIGITERMDESLVVMKMLLGLETADILYMSAKKGGSFTTGPPPNDCIYLVPSFLSPGMQEFFASEFWQGYNRFDSLLYQAAYKSLDNTIDMLGRTEFENQLMEFKRVLKIAHKECELETIYRCNMAGEYVGTNSTCLLWDIGCGYECLNRFDPTRQQVTDEVTEDVGGDQGLGKDER